MTENLPTATAERQQIRTALIALVAEQGYSQTTIEAVLDRADADPAAFARHYPSLDACFAEVWEEYKEEFLRATAEGFASSHVWREGMRAAAWAFCRFLQEDVDRARFFIVELNFGGEAVRAERDLLMARYSALVDRGNEERAGRPVPLAQAEAVVGAIFEIVGTELKAGRLDNLPELVPQGMYLTVYPYLGLDAAQEELRRGPEDVARYRRGEI